MHDFTICGPADQAAVPSSGIEFGSSVFDATFERVECKWFWQAAIRYNPASDSTNQGARHHILHNYLHDIDDAYVTGGAGGRGGAILGNAPYSEVCHNICVNCGNNSLFHAIYGNSNGYSKFNDNNITGTSSNYGGIHIYGKPINTVEVCNNIVSNAYILAWDVTGLNVNGNNLYNSWLDIGNGGSVYTIYGNTLYCPILQRPYGYVAFGGSNGTISGNTIFGCGILNNDRAFNDSWKGASSIKITGNLTTNCSCPLCLKSGSDIQFVNNKCYGTGTANDNNCGLLLTGSKVKNNIICNGNYFKNFAWLAQLYGGVGSFYGENNQVSGCTGLLEVDQTPISNVVLKNTTELDASLKNPYLAGYFNPSSTKVYSILNTQQLSSPSVTLANSATPYVWIGTYFLTGGTTAITNLLGGCVGQTITIQAAGMVTLDHNANANDGYMMLSGESNFAMVTGNTLTLHMFVQGVWQEIGQKNRTIGKRGK